MALDISMDVDSVRADLDDRKLILNVQNQSSPAQVARRLRDGAKPDDE
jgi:hypothetical protein